MKLEDLKDLRIERSIKRIVKSLKQQFKTSIKSITYEKIDQANIKTDGRIALVIEIISPTLVKIAAITHLDHDIRSLEALEKDILDTANADDDVLSATTILGFAEKFNEDYCVTEIKYARRR